MPRKRPKRNRPNRIQFQRSDAPEEPARRRAGPERSDAPEEEVRRRVQDALSDQQVVFSSSEGQTKMSEVLSEFVEPYRDIAGDDEEAYRKLLTIAMVAWNAALLAGQEREALVARMVRTLPRGARKDARAIIAELIERKERFFPQYRRMILDYELTDVGSGWQLVVISTQESH